MAVPNYSTGDPLLDFFFTLFNGIAEVPLFSSPITGILILAGVILASRKAGAMMVLSGLIGAGMAIALGAPYGLVTFGLFGYNSILTGMAFWSGPFVKANKATFFISVFGASYNCRDLDGTLASHGRYVYSGRSGQVLGNPRIYVVLHLYYMGNDVRLKALRT